jgi:FkbM family methyltransferase
LAVCRTLFKLTVLRVQRRVPGRNIEARTAKAAMYQSDLIFDVGMHLGEDTDFYLKKGFRVVGFEANSTFVEHCKARFSDAVASERLVIVHGAVAPGTVSTVPFYVNLVNTRWGTINRDWVTRNERRGAPSKMVEVRRIDLVEYFHQFGMPYYLKIDIEGSDLAAASSLKAIKDRPQFISIETEINRFSRVLEEIELLRSLGYRRFKPVQQKTIEGARLVSLARDGRSFEHVFEPGASGSFGEDLPGEWLDYPTTRRAYRAIFARYWAVGHLSPFFRQPRHKVQRHLQRIIGVAGWHDLHASL